DEDMISREVVATLLTMNGYTLHTAADGAAAFQMLESGACHPQVILLDLSTERREHAEWMRGLRRRCAAALFAIGTVEPGQELRAAADGFLKKPLTLEALEMLLVDKQSFSLAARIAAEPIVQAATLAQFRQLMPEPTVREIYLAVSADLHKRIPELREAIRLKDPQQIRRIGHAIKGGCGMAGALQAARAGALLEEQGEDLEKAAVLTGELQGALERMEGTLEVAFSGQST
ncbi:MAG TPA: Hpt domain-containing protein, partial [Chthonomonadales bacterium]|nr:Hpt domain-containing protein [Chthonomonadales bacterium]